MKSLQAGPTVVRPTYRLIQALRAVAALMVVAHHATILLIERDHLPIGNWVAGSSGVDIFFVISGFVMTISSAPLAKTAHPARTFLARRLERVVPLYWIVTTAKVLVLLLVPAIALNGLGSVWHICSSYLFWPSLSAEGRFEPVVVVGWTLNFEAAFYVLFAAALAWRRRAVLWLTPLFLVAPLLPLSWALRLPVPLRFYYSTLLWEFAMGMLLGHFVQHLRRLPAALGVVLCGTALLPLFFWNEPAVSFWRGLLRGVPAAALVAGVLVLESRWGQTTPRWALELGDASYSIYLVHTFVLPSVGLWLLAWPHGWQGEIVFAMVAAVVLSALAGEAVYRTVELPILRHFKGRRSTAIPANR